MRPRDGPVKTGTVMAGFGSGVAAGLAVGLLGLAGLSVLTSPRLAELPPLRPATELPVPPEVAAGTKEPPRFWPGMSPEERAAREQAALGAASEPDAAQVDTESTGALAAGEADGLAAAPEAGERPDEMAPVKDGTAVVSSETAAPAAPDRETTPAAPPVPSAGEIGSAPVSEPAAPEGGAAPVAPEPTSGAEIGEVAPTGAAPVAGAADVVPGVPAAPERVEVGGAVEAPLALSGTDLATVAPSAEGAPRSAMPTPTPGPQAPEPDAPGDLTALRSVEPAPETEHGSESMAGEPAGEDELQGEGAVADMTRPEGADAEALAPADPEAGTGAEEATEPPSALAALQKEQDDAPARQPEAASAEPGPEDDAAPRPDEGAETLDPAVVVVERPEVMTEPPEEPARPPILTLDGSTLPGVEGVRIRRPGIEEIPAEEVASVQPAEEALSDDALALQRFAADFEAPEDGRPLLSVLLVDDGSMVEGPALLAELGLPVSVALDVPVADAPARAAEWRAAGFEVLAVARLPERPEPQDVEVFLGTLLDAVPETVAVLDAVGQFGGRNATAQMALARVARDGRGLVSAAEGLSADLDRAVAAGVPAARVAREISEGEDAASVRRDLDDAVRRAGQSGGAVVLGRLRPETLEGLLEWSRNGRIGEVAVAPVSAQLLSGTPQ